MPEMRNLTEYLVIKYYVFFMNYYVFSMVSESTIVVVRCI